MASKATLERVKVLQAEVDANVKILGQAQAALDKAEKEKQRALSAHLESKIQLGRAKAAAGL